MDASEIKDEDSLKAWLEGQTREVAVTIAHRAAMRVAPLYWHEVKPTLKESRFSALLTSRPALISGASANGQTDSLKTAAAQAGRDAVIAVDAFDIAKPPDGAALSQGSSIAPKQAALSAVYAATASAYSPSQAVSDAVSCIFCAEDPDPRENWISTRADAESSAVHGTAQGLHNFPLWAGGPNPFATSWEKVRYSWEEAGPGWQFWIDWYDAALEGRPLLNDWDRHWELLTDVALIAPETWDKGPDAVNPEVAKLYAEHKRRAKGPLAEVFNATLFDFRFDHLEGVMRAVPLEQDWKRLEDPALLAAFLSDAQDFLASVELMAAALAAEGSSMQGAGAVRVYLDAVCAELRRAEATDLLRIDKLMELGRILDGMVAREDVRAEFGVLHKPLTDCIEKLRDLVRNHFAHTLARMTPLRDIHMEDDAQPWAVLQDFREIVANVRSGADRALPRLVTEDAAILDDILDSVDGRIRELGLANDDQARSSLQREIDFQLAKVGATASLYREQAMTAFGKSGERIDEGMKTERRLMGLGRWGGRLLELLEKAKDL